MIGKKAVFAMLSVFFISSVAFAGCGNRNAGGDRNQYVNVAINAEPGTLDPSRAVDTYSSMVIYEVQEALTRCEQDSNGMDIIKAAGAESWSVSKDGLTWTFRLRDNKWSDGEPVKASDYEYSIKRTLDPKTASRYTNLLEPIKGAKAYTSGNGRAEDVGVKAVDDKTLVIVLERPCAYFLSLTYFRLFTPQRKDYVEKYGEQYGTEAGTMVYNGPFIVKNWIHKSSVELEKNTEYWDRDSVKLSKATFKILEDEQSRMAEILNGTVDVGSAETKEWKDKFDKTGNFDLISGYEPTTDYIFFNTKDKLFSNLKVRKAFSASLDREEYVNTLFQGTRVPAYSWCPPSLQIDGEEFRAKAGIEPVKELLEEVKDPKALFIEGLKEAGMGEDPSKITVTMTAAGTSAKQKQVEEYLQQVISKALGCNVKIEYMDQAGFMNSMMTGSFQVSSLAWTGDYNDPMTEFDIWTSDSGLNFGRWQNKTYDENIAKAAAAIDKNTRFNAFKEDEEILTYTDAAIAPLDFRQRSQYKRKYVKGCMSTLFGSQCELKYAYTQGRK